MFRARVVGDVVATHRHEHLGQRKLLLVRRLDLDGEEEGHEMIVLDVIGVVMIIALVRLLAPFVW